MEHFDPTSGQPWSQWYARFNLFCNTNHVPAEPQLEEGVFFQEVNQRRTFFLTSIGARAYGVVYCIALPDLPENFPIPMLAAVLQQHYENPGLVEANRLTFHLRSQKGDENVFVFVLSLQELAQYCDFGAHHNSALCSQLILGIKHQDIKIKLLNNPGITWERAKIMAIQDDLVKQQAKRLASVQASVHKLHASAKSKPKPQEKKKSQPPQNPKKEDKKFSPCWYCTKPHKGETCPARKWKCMKCQEIGHAAAACDELHLRRRSLLRSSLFIAYTSAKVLMMMRRWSTFCPFKLIILEAAKLFCLNFHAALLKFFLSSVL